MSAPVQTTTDVASVCQSASVGRVRPVFLSQLWSRWRATANKAGEAMQTSIIAGAAAAVVYVDDVPEGARPEDEAHGRFLVHPHVEDVEPDDPALLGYVEEVYAQPKSIGADYPGAPSFTGLEKPESLRAATRQLAAELARTMGRKRANRGIVFGCLVEFEDGGRAHGIIKVDLDRTQRFHFRENFGGGWSLDEVRDMLPPPKQDFAKYVMAPQPGGTSDAGIRDETTGAESAADYLLEAAGLTVPRLRGTKARVGNEALRAGVSIERVHDALTEVRDDTPTEEVFASKFAEVPEGRVERASGTATRPMPQVLADDTYVRVYETRRPVFKLEVGPEIRVERIGNRIEIELPADADDVETRLR